MVSFSDQDGITFRRVPVRDLIEKQRAEAVRVLSEVVNELKVEDMAHKAAFREKKIRQPFDQVLYALEKISEDLRGSSVAPMGAWGAEHLQFSLDQFEGLLKERGLGIDTYDSIQYQFEKIQYPLTQLRKFLARQPSDIPSQQAALVFADALRSSFSELMEMAEEIDQEYAAVSD